jgi:Kef-type K+ transport system membrane component KefB
MVAHQDRLVALVFLDLVIVIVAGTVLAAAARRLRQPSVLGEILAGIALGPSLLGLLPGHLVDVLFPREVRSVLGAVAQLGLVAFMFLIGHEADLGRLRGSVRATVAVATASITLPFALGFALVAALWRGQADWVPLALFIGAAMAITAFPVLARILAEHGLQHTRAGTLSLLSAAINDVVAWCLLALVVTLVAASSTAGLVLMLAELAAFVAAMLVVVRPLLHAWVRRLSPSPSSESLVLVVLVSGLLLASWCTAVIGLHAVFGAFVFGVITPRLEIRRAAPDAPDQIGQLSTLLLPVFFVVTGLSVDIGGLGWRGLAELLLVVAVACAGKFGGAATAARAIAFGWRDAITIGVLMNARGLTELIILQVGLDLGILHGRLFTIMVIMAVVTTAMTGPVLRRTGHTTPPRVERHGLIKEGS